MARAAAGSIEIEYECRGEAGGEPLLLVHGLGVQLVQWPERFIDALIERGFRVIVYDNRDVGLSTRCHDWGPADIPEAFRQARAREQVSAPYTLEDMADDAAALLEALDIPSAHVVGLSNGGAIAQLLAIRHPDRVATLVSISATSGRRGLPRPGPEAAAWLAAPKNPAGTREGAIAEALESARILGSPGFPPDEATIRETAARSFERAFYPDGNSRHLLASIASGDSRVAKLGEIQAPALVIHGAEDPLVPLACGTDVRDSIAGAGLLVIEGMAHDLPGAVIPRIADAIRDNARRRPVRKG
ncbi:MAG: alpha/beta hydrolase [Pseudomonadales bacterium]|nr:alpha/beta hydrolase [Pseudomonadales bacterium]